MSDIGEQSDPPAPPGRRLAAVATSFERIYESGSGRTLALGRSLMLMRPRRAVQRGRGSSPNRRH